jgi:uncharacterized protein YjbJ (UPF0337 family)
MIAEFMVRYLVGLVQEKYGYSREQAETEIDRHLTEYEKSAR